MVLMQFLRVREVWWMIGLCRENSIFGGFIIFVAVVTFPSIGRVRTIYWRPASRSAQTRIDQHRPASPSWEKINNSALSHLLLWQAWEEVYLASSRYALASDCTCLSDDRDLQRHRFIQACRESPWNLKIYQILKYIYSVFTDIIILLLAEWYFC